MNDYSINAVITLDTSEYKKGINEAQKSTKTFSGNFQKLTKGLGGALLKGGAIGLGITAVTKGLQGLSKVVNQSIKEWEDASAAQKKLAQTLKVTGAEAWTTTEDLNAMADAYQKATNYSSNDVTQMQTVLLGFKNISQDTFQSASDAILDMAEVMGMDLVSATQTVGKALDDPINGMGSLSRQGFKFSEAEKELIKNLVEAGETAKAQKIILDELNTTYGGAAKEGVKASTQLKNSWKSLLQEMGRNITMAIDIEPAKKKLTELLDHWREIQKEMADVKEYTDNVIKAQKAINEGTATYQQNLLVVEDEIKKIEDLRSTYEISYQKSVAEGWEDDARYWKEHIDALNRELKPLQNRKKIIEDVIALEKQESENRETANEKIKEQEARESSIAALKLKYLKLIAEQEKKWELQEKVTGKTVDLEEKRNFYQEKLVAIMEEANGEISTANQYYKDQQSIIADITAEIEKQKQESVDIASWDEKILDMEIQRLEANRENHRAGGKGDQLSMELYYFNEINKLKDEQLQRDLDREMKAVEGTKNAEEAKNKIQEYFNNLRIKNQLERQKELEDIYAKHSTEEVNEEKKTFKELLVITKNYVLEVSSLFSKMTLEVGKILAGLGKMALTLLKSLKGFGTNLFNFNIDDALDNLLVFEDKILTFFVETLPRLPGFLASALQSVGVLLQNILSSGGLINLGGLLGSMLNSIISSVPNLIKQIVPVVGELIKGIMSALDSANLSSVFDGLLDMIMSGIEWVFRKLTTLIPKILKLIINVVKKLMSKLPQLINVIVPALSNVITDIVKALPSMLDAMIPTLLQAVLEMIKALMQNLPQILQAIIETLPQLIFGIITAVSDFIANLKAEDFVAIVGGVIKAVATLGVSLVKNIPEILKGLWELAKGLIKGMWNLLLEALKATWKGLKWVLDLVVDWFKNTFGGYATGTNNAQKGYALVGEAGPELIKFNGGEQVLNAKNTQKALAATGNAGNTFNVTFNNLQDTSAYAMMSQLRQYKRQMAINGII